MPSPTSAVLSALLIALAAGSAAAQTQSAVPPDASAGACGQPAALSHRLPEPLDATPAAPLRAAFARAEPVYLEFQLAAEGRVVLRTKGAEQETDSLLALFDASGAALAQDDDGGGGLDAQIDISLPAGTYCAQMRPVAAGAGETQLVTLALAAGPDAEALTRAAPTGGEGAALCGDPALTEDAAALAPGFGRLAAPVEVASGGRRDLRFTTASELTLQADARSRAFDTRLKLVDGTGTLVAENDDAPGLGTDSRLAARLPPGSYCLSLSGFDGAGGTAEIVLVDTPEIPIVGPLSTACTDAALTADFGTAMAPGLGSPAVSATLEPGRRADWRIEVTAPVTLQFDARSGGFDTVLSLVSEAGEVLATSDDAPGFGTDSRFAREMEPGRYCLAVESLGGGSGAYTLAASETLDAVAPAIPGGPAPCTAPELLGPDLDEASGAAEEGFELAPNGRRDWRLTLAEDTDVELSAASGDFDTRLRLTDAAGATLAENDDYTEASTDSLIETRLPAGSYCLSLDSFAGGGGAAMLSFTPAGAAAPGLTPPAEDSGEIEDLGALESALASSTPVSARVKWVAFELKEAGRIAVDAVSAGGDFTLVLLDRGGATVGSTEGTAGLAPAHLEAALEPGRYLVAMALKAPEATPLRNISIRRLGE